MQTHYPVDAFLTAFRDGKNPTRPQAEPSWLAVIRHGDRIRRMALEQGEYRLLQRLAEGTPFGFACEQAAGDMQMSDEEFAPSLQVWFARWLENGILQDFLPSAPSSS